MDPTLRQFSTFLVIFVLFLFKRGASEAAAGCLESVAAKLVKTAIEIHIYIRVKINHRRQIWDILVRFRATPKFRSVILARENKSPAANLGHFGAISCDSKISFCNTCAWK